MKFFGQEFPELNSVTSGFSIFSQVLCLKKMSVRGRAVTNGSLIPQKSLVGKQQFIQVFSK